MNDSGIVPSPTAQAHCLSPKLCPVLLPMPRLIPMNLSLTPDSSATMLDRVSSFVHLAVRRCGKIPRGRLGSCHFAASSCGDSENKLSQKSDRFDEW